MAHLVNATNEIISRIINAIIHNYTVINLLLYLLLTVINQYVFCATNLSQTCVFIVFKKKKKFLNGFNVPIKFTFVFTFSSLVSIPSLHHWQSIMTPSPFE